MAAQQITDAIAFSERIKDELIQLDEMIQVYQKVENIVKANEEIQKNNLFFAVFQWSHSDSLMIRLRRLVDKDNRTGSLYLLCKFIAKNAAVFDKTWYAAIYAGTPVESLAKGWWSDVATANGDHVCPVKLMKMADDLMVSATACSDWINQTVAHLDRNATVPAPTWGHYHGTLDEIKEVFKKVHCMLTGYSCDTHITIAIDWEFCLMVPWMKPSTRFLALQRRARAAAEVSSSPAPHSASPPTT